MTGSEYKALGRKEEEEEVLERLCALVLAGDHGGVERELAAVCGGAGAAPAWMWREVGARRVTLVHLAAGVSCRLTRLLLQRGAPADPPCSERVSPADIAASWRRHRTLALLRRHARHALPLPSPAAVAPAPAPNPAPCSCGCGCAGPGDPTCGAWLAGAGAGGAADYLAREARALRLRRLLEAGARGAGAGAGAGGGRGRWASSLVYLLLDGRAAAQLDYANSSGAPLPPADTAPAPTPHHRALWLAFLSSVFYIGKGCRSRPYAHLQSAVRAWRRVGAGGAGGAAGAGGAGGASSKDARIVQVWAAGAGVVCLPAFDGLTAREALAREALLIEALGGPGAPAGPAAPAASTASAALPTRLCNERAGAATALRALGAGGAGGAGAGADANVDAGTRRALGLHLARRACLALLAAPPPPLRPHHVD